MKQTIALIFLSVFLSCNTNSRKEEKDKGFHSTTLKLNWIFTGSFAPEAFAADEFDKQNGLDLKIEAGGQGRDPLKLVGDNQFGAAAADEILRANDKGGDFVIIGVINYNSPACFLSLDKSGIKTPKDFEGKIVGLLPFGSTGLIYKILLKRTGVDPSKIKEVSVYPDLKVFIGGNIHQVQPAFVYDETVSLDMENIKYNVIEPKDYGVSFKGPCYFTTSQTIIKNPALVQRFINTVAQGMSEAIKFPEKAIASLKKLSPDIKEERELKVWQKGLNYYKGYQNRPLTSDTASWADMTAELINFKELKNKPDLTKTLNFSFINNYYLKH